MKFIMIKKYKDKILAGAFVMTLALFGFVLSTNNAYAATCTAAATGNWNTVGTWSCGHVPLAADDVVINSGATVTVDTTAVANTVTINAAAVANGLTIASPNSLTVTGAVTMNAATAAVASTLAVGTGTLSAASIAIPGSVTATQNTIVSVGTTGTITTTGSITFSGGPAQAQLNLTGNAIVNVGGDLTSGGTLAGGTSTINFTGAGAQAVGTYTTYNNVGKTGAGTATMSGTTTFGGTLSVTAGTLDTASSVSTVTGATTVATGGTLMFSNVAGVKTFTGSVTVNAGGIWNETAAVLPTFGGSLTNNGTFTALAGIHTFTAVGTHNLAGTLAIPNLDIAGAGVVTNNGTLTVANALSTSATGGFTQGAAGVLNLGGVTNTAGLNAGAAGNIVNYTALGPQTVMASGGGYSNINLNGSGTKTIGAGLTIGANTSIATGVIANLTGASTSNTLSLGGIGQAAGVFNLASTPAFFAGTGGLTVATSNSAGQGTATINGAANATVTTGTSNTFTVVLTVGAAGITAAATNPTFTIPTGFTAPNAAPVANAGLVLVDGNWSVSALGGTCAVGQVGPTGAALQVITVDVTAACVAGNTITLTYKGTSSTVGAATPLVIATDDAAAGTGVLPIATPPTITVAAVPVPVVINGSHGGGGFRRVVAPVVSGSIVGCGAMTSGFSPVTGASCIGNVVTLPTFIPGCGNLNVGFSTVTGQSCANNATFQQTPIPGCGNSNTGFSTVSGVSCAGNPVSVNIAGTGVDDFNFGTANLLSGSKGEEVVELQTFLNRFNNAGLATDGDFGPKTKLAVMKWQSGHNLVSDGVVGPKSKAEMQSWASTH
jgi:hypothetical protein